MSGRTDVAAAVDVLMPHLEMYFGPTGESLRMYDDANDSIKSAHFRRIFNFAVALTTSFPQKPRRVGREQSAKKNFKNFFNAVSSRVSMHVGT